MRSLETANSTSTLPTQNTDLRRQKCTLKCALPARCGGAKRCFALGQSAGSPLQGAEIPFPSGRGFGRGNLPAEAYAPEPFSMALPMSGVFCNLLFLFEEVVLQNLRSLPMRLWGEEACNMDPLLAGPMDDRGMYVDRFRWAPALVIPKRVDVEVRSIPLPPSSPCPDRWLD